MCGLVGFFGGSYKRDVVIQMMNQLFSRGPDDFGVWTSEPNRLALAHRRLSIVDLSSAGSQPMTSSCGRYVIVFNGEIYNHKVIRSQLVTEGCSINWRGHSDTETLLVSLAHWGLENCLKKLNGMFAFALWDNLEKKLFLARDRMGEKPLYYGRIGDVFLFGSEIKALKSHPAWLGEINRDVLALFFRYGHIPTPWSIYKDIFKLPPAHFLVISDSGRLITGPTCYWNLQSIVANGNQSYSLKSPSECVDELDVLLRDAVKNQMVADVPLGAFLSGGYDSTAIVALMQAQSVYPIKTFSIGFHEAGFNEAIHAKRIAKYLGTKHTELYVTHREAMDVIPKLPLIYDEPFSDVSQIPTYLVSQLARQHVTVCLTGDGGDELFCGYNRYLSGFSIWNKLSRLPLPVRKFLAELIELVPGYTLDKMQNYIPSKLQLPSFANRLPKLANVLLHQDLASYYKSLVSHTQYPSQIVLGAIEPNNFLNKKLNSLALGSQEKMMLWDMLTYLPDDILVKTDRSTMAVSLEARVPMLDYRVVEFSTRIPISLKYRDGQGKWLLREVLYRYVPRELMDRPKMGFSVPIGYWLRGPLRNWAESMLSEDLIRKKGYLDPKPIRQMWKEHLNGKQNWHQQLWDVLMFQAWIEGGAH